VRLSPERERIALIATEDKMDCGANIFNYKFTVFSKSGEQLFRFGYDFRRVEGYDFHPDGRLVLLVSHQHQDHYQIEVETAPGSFEFSTLFEFNAPPGISNYTGFVWAQQATMRLLRL